MKIVLASDSYLPVISGVTTVVSKLAYELSKRKHQVSIVCMGTKTKFSFSKERNVSVFRFPSIPNPVRTDHRIPIPISLKIRKAMEQTRPDIIHIHTPGTVGFWALVFGLKHKIPIVATCHGVPGFLTSYFDFLPEEFSKSAEKTLWQCYSWFFNQVNFVISPSKYIKSQLAENGVRVKKVILPMWIDPPYKTNLSKKQLRKKWQVPEKKTVFLYFGRLDKDKNLETLVKASEILIKKPNSKLKNKFFLLMAGGGCQKEKIEEIVVKKRLTNSIKFTGYITGRNIGEIYQLSDFFVMPALFEAQNIVTLQAISYGLKALVAESGALVEIAERFPNSCLTFNPAKVLDLTKKMEKFITDLPKKTYKPTEKPEQTYGKNAILDQIESIYRQTIENRHSLRQT